MYVYVCLPAGRSVLVISRIKRLLNPTVTMKSKKNVCTSGSDQSDYYSPHFQLFLARQTRLAIFNTEELAYDKVRGRAYTVSI